VSDLKASVVFALIQLVLAMLIGLILLAQIIANANTTGTITGEAETVWDNLVAMTWVAVGLMAIFPLVYIGASLMGFFGQGGE
jgi:hypothetical protein